MLIYQRRAELVAVGWNIALMEYKGFILNYRHLSDHSSHSGPQDPDSIFLFPWGDVSSNCLPPSFGSKLLLLKPCNCEEKPAGPEGELLCVI